MLDTWAPQALNRHGGAVFDEVDVLMGLARDYGLACTEDELRAWPRDARLEHVVNAARRAQLLPDGAGRHELERLILTYQVNLEITRRHVPGPFSGRTLLYLAAQTGIESPEEAQIALGWNAGESASIETHVVSGSHQTLVFEPDVASVGGLLAHELSLVREPSFAR
jgi:thioesterase domain-containing protein